MALRRTVVVCGLERKPRNEVKGRVRQVWLEQLLCALVWVAPMLSACD